MNKIILVGKIKNNIKSFKKDNKIFVKFHFETFNQFGQRKSIPIIAWKHQAIKLLKINNIKKKMVIEGFLDWFYIQIDKKNIKRYIVNLILFEILDV